MRQFYSLYRTVRQNLTTILFAIAVLNSSFMLSGCGAEASEDNDTSSNVSFSLLKEAGYIEYGTTTNKQHQVVRSKGAFEPLLSEYTSDSVDADLSDSVVLLLDMGERPSGGYGVTINSAIDYGEFVKVSVIYELPGNGCLVEDWIQNPYLFALVNTRKEVLIEEQISSISCSDE